MEKYGYEFTEELGQERHEKRAAEGYECLDVQGLDDIAAAKRRAASQENMDGTDAHHD